MNRSTWNEGRLLGLLTSNTRGPVWDTGAVRFATQCRRMHILISLGCNCPVRACTPAGTRLFIQRAHCSTRQLLPMARYRVDLTVLCGVRSDFHVPLVAAVVFERSRRCSIMTDDVFTMTKATSCRSLYAVTASCALAEEFQESWRGRLHYCRCCVPCC